MRLMTTLTATLVLVSLVLVPSTASAITIEATHDSWGINGYWNEEWNADTNVGPKDYLLTKWQGPGPWNRKAWTKFDLSSVTQETATATFQIVKTGASTGPGELTLQVYALNDLDPSEGWDEATVTYNTSPAIEGYENVNEYDPARVTDMMSTIIYTTETEPGMLEFSSPELAAAVNADTDNQLSLLLLQTPENGYSPAWASHENIDWPAATLVLVPVPEPSTFALGIGMAMVLASCRRRRRR